MRRDHASVYNLAVGAVRPFVLQSGPGNTKNRITPALVVARWDVTPGSMLVLTGEDNANLWHGVPKDTTVTELRVSIGFREETMHSIKTARVVPTPPPPATGNPASAPAPAPTPMPTRSRKPTAGHDRVQIGRRVFPVRLVAAFATGPLQGFGTLPITHVAPAGLIPWSSVPVHATGDAPAGMPMATCHACVPADGDGPRAQRGHRRGVAAHACPGAPCPPTSTQRRRRARMREAGGPATRAMHACPRRRAMHAAHHPGTACMHAHGALPCAHAQCDVQQACTPQRRTTSLHAHGPVPRPPAGEGVARTQWGAMPTGDEASVDAESAIDQLRRDLARQANRAAFTKLSASVDPAFPRRMLGETVDSVATETATRLTSVDAAHRRSTTRAPHERACNDTGLLVAALRADVVDATRAIRADPRTAADTFTCGKIFHHIPLGVALAGVTVTTNAVVELDGSTDSITAHVEGFPGRGSSDLLTIAELQHVEVKAPKTI